MTQVCGGTIELIVFYDHALFNARQKTHVCPQPKIKKWALQSLQYMHPEILSPRIRHFTTY